MESKRCHICTEVKPLSEFHRQSSSKDGHQSRCKECACRHAREWSRHNRGRANATSRARRDAQRGGPPTAPASYLVERDGETLKVCGVCGEEKPLDSFYRHPQGSGGVRDKCIPCSVRTAYKWNRDNIARFRANQKKHRLRVKYGLTDESVAELVEKQQGKCAVCRDELVPSATHIDHCHAEGQVRGLLCRACNTGLGLFKDDEKRLLAAVKYLRAARRQPAA